jgi:alkaline phosphatase D
LYSEGKDDYTAPCRRGHTPPATIEEEAPMPTMHRRELLRLLGSAGVFIILPGMAGCSDDPAPSPRDASSDGHANTMTDAVADASLAPDASSDATPDADPGPREGFLHGVASGDPLPEGVILWTRITPPSPAPMSVEVQWEVSTTREFTSPVRMGTFSTHPGRDYTVKVDVTGLSPATTYYYRFRALGFTSPVGRTKTAPQGMVPRARFAVCSCSNYAHGYFHAYRNIARRDDIDAVIHLGDYIYEYGNGQYGNVRTLDPPTEIVTLDDYRRRYRHYRRDPDLQAAHAAHPFITVWDDHEFTNDAWRDGAENHMPATEGAWATRRAVATQAYMEWLPIREQGEGRIFRRLRYGDLLDLVLLDTRIWGRDEQAPMSQAMDARRQLLGADQERWFFEQLTTSTARWKLVGQQVMMGQLSVFFNNDQWDGYAAARGRFFSLLRSMRIDNVVVLTGDIHSSWAYDLAENPSDPTAYDPATGRGSLAVEFVCPAVTSPGLPAALIPSLMQLTAGIRNLKYVDGNRRGYMLVDVTPERTQTQWFYVADVTMPEGFAETMGPTFATRNGRNHLERVT